MNLLISFTWNYFLPLIFLSSSCQDWSWSVADYNGYISRFSISAILHAMEVVLVAKTVVSDRTYPHHVKWLTLAPQVPSNYTNLWIMALDRYYVAMPYQNAYLFGEIIVGRETQIGPPFDNTYCRNLNQNIRRSQADTRLYDGKMHNMTTSRSLLHLIGLCLNITSYQI